MSKTTLPQSTASSPRELALKKGAPMRRGIAAAVALLTVVCATLTGCAPDYSGSGTVVGHSHTNAHLQPFPVPCGKTTCITLISIPASWKLEVDVPEREENIHLSVQEDVYNIIRNGATVEIQNGEVIFYKNP